MAHIKGCNIETAKTDSLNLDNDFRKNVINPLKRSMIHGDDMKSHDLEVRVRSIHTQATNICRDLGSRVNERQDHLARMALEEEIAKMNGTPSKFRLRSLCGRLGIGINDLEVVRSTPRILKH